MIYQHVYYLLDPDAVFQASLSLAGFVLDSDSPSITQMLQEGHPVMALSSLLYAPNTFSQVISFYHRSYNNCIILVISNNHV